MSTILLCGCVADPYAIARKWIGSEQETPVQPEAVADEAAADALETPDLHQEILRDEISGLQSEESKTKPLLSKHLKLTLPDSGWDVFAPASASHPDYRFNPSIMIQPDGRIDAWFSAPGDGYREYDYITYKYSEDLGQTWSDETVVLSPTPNSPDSLSVCDPDVFWYKGYYYIGYSSTINKKAKGLCNSAFIARSRNPAGPYEKWNGQGWGGLPVPFVYFDGVNIGWGCGEPSFVVKDDVLYVYTTKDSYSDEPKRIRLTEVHTADLTDENWPASLQYCGVAVDRSDTEETETDKNDPEDPYRYQDADCWDVAYVEKASKFIAVGTNRRFLNNSCLVYYESNDGVHFDRISELNTNVIARCHNCGIMADPSAHIRPEDPVYIGYAYGGSNHSAWGLWGTRFVKAELSVGEEEIDRSEDGAQNLKAPLDCRAGIGSASPIMVKTDRLVYRRSVSGGPFSIGQYLRDGYHGGHVLASGDVVYQVSDPGVVRVNEQNMLEPLSDGITSVTVYYQGLSREVAVCIPKEDTSAAGITGFYPMVEEYTVPLQTPYIVQIRPMGIRSDESIRELTGEEILQIGLTFTSADPSICDVRADGRLYPGSFGRTKIHVETEGGLSYDIEVHII